MPKAAPRKPRARRWAAALVFALCGAPSGAQETLLLQDPPQEATIPASPASAQEEELFELDEIDEIDAPPPAPVCDASLPTGAVAGAWSKQIAPLPLCAARLLAKSQYRVADDASRALWCSDPAGAKARLRAGASRKIELWRARESALERAAPAAPAPSAAQPAWLAWAQPPARKAAPFAPARQDVPTGLDPNAKLPLQWDVREARACAQSIPDELGPSIAAYAGGRAGSCPAAMVEASLATGRHAGSRASWVVAPGCVAPVDPAALASAIASGQEALQAWQDRQAREAGWVGLPARPAVARSADGR